MQIILVIMTILLSGRIISKIIDTLANILKIILFIALFIFIISIDNEKFPLPLNKMIEYVPCIFLIICSIAIMFEFFPNISFFTFIGVMIYTYISN